MPPPPGQRQPASRSGWWSGRSRRRSRCTRQKRGSRPGRSPAPQRLGSSPCSLSSPRWFARRPTASWRSSGPCTAPWTPQAPSSSASRSSTASCSSRPRISAGQWAAAPRRQERVGPASRTQAAATASVPARRKERPPWPGGGGRRRRCAAWSPSRSALWSWQRTPRRCAPPTRPRCCSCAGARARRSPSDERWSRRSRCRAPCPRASAPGARSWRRRSRPGLLRRPTLTPETRRTW
mmetsp:Transcript_2842/g.11480  ORF Transcript_2842/g.11480 Transcript_2842/m.11480 type:complete len:237 (+) Transcript_2842:757-1467(+)